MRHLVMLLLRHNVHLLLHIFHTLVLRMLLGRFSFLLSFWADVEAVSRQDAIKINADVALVQWL